TWFLWDGDAMAGEVRRTARHAREARFYVYRQDGFEPLAMQVDDGACKRVYFYQNDPNGAPVRLSSADGDIVWETHYSVTGGVEWVETRKVEQAIRLQGQYFDDESGLHYNRYRYFDPGTGQFISQDPIGLIGGINPYRFAPNAFGWIDPLGLKIFGIDDLHPGTITDSHPDGIFTIQAAGSRHGDKVALYSAAGLKESFSSEWISHHIDYNPATNEMRMQLVAVEPHRASHAGGIKDFELDTGLIYGTDESKTEAAKRSREHASACSKKKRKRRR
ncbi:RHS repeat-associated core domain-containing protein, partial [Caballeronia sp. LZ065]|uniref:RHS repeat-associated core domain-containing protein n=1 Tax=Caballeronia sp. LZ065 TaxID=3038571 RepID=UPI0028647B33